MKDARFARFGDVAPIWRFLNRFGDRKKRNFVIGNKKGNLAEFPKFNYFLSKCVNNQNNCQSYEPSGSEATIKHYFLLNLVFSM